VRNRRGFALLAALWLLVALSVVGLEFGLRARAHRLSTANVTEHGRATAAAEAGIADAHALLAELLNRPGSIARGDVDRTLDPWGGPELFLGDSVVLDGARYRVTLADAGAALHLNRATEEQLRSFFAALRIDFGKADRLAQAIMDWRDGDDLHRARGAEREDYLALGAAVLPENRPFERLSDLRHVLGMTAEIYALVRPYLTLLGTGQVNLNSASRPVILALPGMTDRSVAIVLRRRSGRQPLRNLMELANELPTEPREALQSHFAALLPLVAFATREVMATSTGWVDGSPVRAVVTGLFARGGSNAFLISRSAQ
jgi:general secretion pathway protein K